MVGGLSTIFCQYHETGKSRIRSHKYQNPKTCTSIVGFNANFLYLYCSGQEMPCGKEEHAETNSKESCEELFDQVMKGELFGFLPVDIHIPGELTDKFSEFCPLFILDVIPKELIPNHMKEYQERTGRNTIPGTKKLFGVMRAEKILLYSPLLKWYVSHGLKVTTVNKYVMYKPGKPFKWFPEEVSQTRRNGDSNPALKQLGDTYKLK